MPIIESAKVRIWSKNPRYTNFEDIDFDDIGKDDFKINPFGEYRDLYSENVEKYYLKLIDTPTKIKSMVSLLESLAEGYNPNIDDVIVAWSPFLNRHRIFDGNKKFVYVIEGNRRIFAINILLNTSVGPSPTNSVKPRELMRSKTKSMCPALSKRLERVYAHFDQNNVNLDFIEVKSLDIDSVGKEKIWNTLNARHFGQRKGKMNWPRGLVLSSIDKKIRLIRNDLGLQVGEKMLDEDYKKLKRHIENFSGKEISERDLEMALWTRHCFDVYNAQENIRDDQKVDFIHTNEQSYEETYEVSSEIKGSDEDYEEFKISSLELSMTTIKILTNDGTRKTLRELIGLKNDTKRWIVTAAKLDKTLLEHLIIYVINLIKLKILNTRHFKEEYEIELKRILSLKDKNEELIALTTKDVSKIAPENLPLSVLMKKDWREYVDFSRFSDEKREEYIKKFESVKLNILPLLDRSLMLEQKYLEIAKIKDPFLYSLVYMWIIELNTIMKNKSLTPAWDFPLFVFGAALRGTSELLMLMLIEKNVDNPVYTANQNLFTDPRTIEKFKEINTIPYLIEGWIKATKNLSDFTKPFIKDIYKIFFVYKTGNGNKVFETLVELNKILISINADKSDNYDNSILEKMALDLEKFLSWSGKPQKYNGVSNVLNSLIHTPSLLRNIHNDSNLFQLLSKEFDSQISVIMDFIEFIIS